MNIQTILDNKLKEENDVPRERSGKFSPSKFGQCFRRQILSRHDYPISNPVDSRTLRVFKVGHMFHEFIQGLVPGEAEVEVNEKDIKGFADIVTDDMVVDLKTCHSRKFWHMGRRKDETEDEAVKRFQEQEYGNILQVMSYCMFLDKPLGKLVYISKDDLCINEYVFKLQDWKTKVQEELFIIRTLWEKKRLPHAIPRLYKQKDGSFKECEYCSFRDACKELGEEAIQNWNYVKEENETS